MTDLLFRPFVEAALREDLRSGDITTDALIPADLRGVAAMNFRVDGIVCGLQLAKIAFETLDLNAEIEILAGEGALVKAGDTVLRARATGRALLSAERVALNFVQRLSGIATLTAQFVAETQGTKARIADTRKTTPGLRLLEKYAVKCGGASNHRFALDDLVLIKDNHIALCGGISQAVERARQNIGHATKIEVECDTLVQVKEAVFARADILLLDNMGPQLLQQATQIIGGRALAEASGGVNLETVRAIAQSGVDIISVGALTHGAKSLDIGLDVEI
ncbi:nicotinate-nucleotide pyrophosphorylase [carboxylating] [Abditibacterium utsteinense]|uniref:Probable nicotinate-nucleotide pyrophosphorylase [carboxylating] n=1 Tax=Abditibacterium utsteinense TaxID=1960156 RepID=A0A2S8SXM1_9BACT|nr:carboxylating nicotinate-nucleotide diphosphorylase [Abditibacterium utsteinense]PQV65553.1 nicotinate-nucleotide pyrophosphorylase [carboxylating] [Abditibacterium utsteinense]